MVESPCVCGITELGGEARFCASSLEVGAKGATTESLANEGGRG